MKRLDRLSPFHLDAYYTRLGREGLRPGSIRQIRAVLRGALGEAHRWGWLPTNPAAATRPPRRRKPTIDLPSPQQTRRLLVTATRVSRQFGCSFDSPLCSVLAVVSCAGCGGRTSTSTGEP